MIGLENKILVCGCENLVKIRLVVMVVLMRLVMVLKVISVCIVLLVGVRVL